VVIGTGVVVGVTLLVAIGVNVAMGAMVLVAVGISVDVAVVVVLVAVAMSVVVHVAVAVWASAAMGGAGTGCALWPLAWLGSGQSMLLAAKAIDTVNLAATRHNRRNMVGAIIAQRPQVASVWT
jgi:hypothetical protein